MTATTEDMIVDALTSALRDCLADEAIFTPEFLAERFWDMDSEKQAQFFNRLAAISGDDGWPAMQWRHMQESLLPEGKAILDEMKNHTDPTEAA